MFDLHLDTSQETDFTVLTKRLHKAEKRQIELLPNDKLNDLVSQGILSKSDLEEYRRKILAHNKTLNWKLNCSLSKTDSQLHSLAKFYEKGIINTEGYTLMRINLAPCISDIVAIMSRLKNYTPVDLSSLNKSIAKLCSGLIENDYELQETLTDLIDTGDPVLTAYIYKALSRDNHEVVIEPLFSVKYIYKNLTALESIVLPLSLSLNMLSYAIVGQLYTKFRRGDKRFICVDKHSIYYHVRDGMVPFFKGGTFYVDGVKLNTTIEEIPYPIREKVLV